MSPEADGYVHRVWRRLGPALIWGNGPGLGPVFDPATGETHFLSENRSRMWPRTWSWTAFLLGLFEIVLGLMLVVEPMGRGPWVYLAASVWALIGGVILLGDAVRLRRIRQRRERLHRLRRQREVAADGE